MNKRLIITVILTAAAAITGIWPVFADQYTGGTGDGWSAAESAELDIDGPVVVISSAQNQIFKVSDYKTAAADITITDSAGGAVTAANDIRITVPTSFGVKWKSYFSGTIDTSDENFAILNPIAVSASNIDVTTGAGPYIIGDTVTVTWDNTVATGDGAGTDNDDVTGVTCDFSSMEGGETVTMYDDGTNGGDATADDDIWTASYDITAGTVDTATATVAVTATDGTSTKTTADTTDLTVDNIVPVLTDGNISITSTGSGTGGVYLAGDTVTAEWDDTASGDNNTDTISTVTCDFSALGGGAAVSMTDSSDTWTASYDIDNTSTTGTHAVSLLATDNAGNTTTTADTTDIEVGASTLTLTSPDPGTTHSFKAGTSQTIAWTAGGDTTSVTITYSTNSGETYPNTITTVANSAGANSYDWTTASDLSSNVRIKLHDTDCSAVYDTSDIDFTIAIPTLTLLTPSASGITMSVGDSYNITWSSEGAVSDDLSLYFSTNSGTAYPDTISSSEANDGTYTWTVPAEAGSELKVRIQNVFYQELNNTSDADFDAGTASSLTVSGSGSNGALQLEDYVLSFSPMTITDNTGVITAANDIRIRIPSAFGMTWNTAHTTAVITGSAAGKVSTEVSYESSDKVLVLDVISDFTAGDAIVVSGLAFNNLSAVSSSDNLELDIYNTGATYITDSNHIEIKPASSALFIGGTGDGWDYAQSADLVLE